MDAKTNLKAKLPSRHVTEGPERAPHRSYYYAMGLTAKIHQPFVGVATCWNEAAPCNIALMRQAQAVKKGVAAAGGTPREFCTITVTDGIAMGHEGMKSSLPSREVIADSVELTMRGHCYDALVGLAGCDKSLPGMMMAMCRLNVPSVFIYGGSILPGTLQGQGRHRAGRVRGGRQALGRQDVGRRSRRRSSRSPVRRPAPAAASSPPTPWRRVSEAIGLALPYSAGAPAPYEIRDRVLHDGRRAGHGADRAQHPPARHRHPQGAGECRHRRRRLRRLDQCRAASAGDRARVRASSSTCSTSPRSSSSTPYIADLKPGGRYVAKDMFEAGGVPLLMKTLLDHGFLHGDCMTVTGRTIAENLKSVKWNPDQDVVRPADKPLLADRRRRRPQGQSRAGRRDREGRRHEDAQVHRPGALLRRRGGLLRGGQDAQVQGRRRARHPLRGPARAAPACARCCRPRPRSTARAWAARSRSSPTAASPAPRAASASAMSARRRRSAARSRCCATATSSRSTPSKGTLERQALARPNLRSAGRAGSRARPNSAPAICGNTPSRSGRRVDGAVTHPGGAAEKACYADI